MGITQDLRDRGGVTLTAHIAALGYSPNAIRKAVDLGLVVRPRKRWLALTDADPALVFAAQHGVILSCITQAKRLGLWVLNHNEAHFAARSRGRRLQVHSGIVHWQLPLIIRAPETLVDPIENVLHCVAHCQPHDVALAIWDSALNKGLTDYASLDSLPLRSRARQLLEETTPFADSGLETFFRTRLSWLQISIRFQTWIHGHRVDFLIGDRLVVQIDGKQHSGTQRTEDMQHDADLTRSGHHVIRVNYELVTHRWHVVQQMILEAISRGLHLVRWTEGERVQDQPDAICDSKPPRLRSRHEHNHQQDTEKPLGHLF